jgi:signal peptidase II
MRILRRAHWEGPADGVPARGTLRHVQAARRTTVANQAEPAESGDDTAADPTAPARGRKLPVVVGVALFVLALDVVTKIVVVHTLAHHAPIRLLGGFLTLLLLRNSGAAFSIGTSMTIVFTVIAAAVIVYILRTARKLRSLPWAITLGLLLGGATGNLADRIFRAPGLFRGDVVDWIELPHWPVFNLADSAIVCGGVIAVLLAILGLHMDGTREVREPAGRPPDAAGSPDTAGDPGTSPASGTRTGTGTSLASGTRTGTGTGSAPADSADVARGPAETEGTDGGGSALSAGP